MLVLAAGSATVGGGATAAAIGAAGILCAIAIATSARRVRGALAAGVAVALGLLLLQLVLAWFLAHPIEKS